MSTPKVEKSERSRNLILASALGLFSTQGYRGTSIREIAAGAGLSTGNVYHHFPDKEALFKTLLDQYWEAVGSADSPFNKALAEGAFPHDLEGLARAAEESIRAHRQHLNLVHVDVAEFDGVHLRKYYTSMAARFSAYLRQRWPGDTLKAQLAPGCNPNTAIMVASTLFLQYFSVEILFGVPGQFGADGATAIGEICEILRHGMLRSEGSLGAAG